MLWARVVRGISSTENEVTPVAAISCTVCTIAQRPQEADQRLALAQQRQIGLAGHVVGAVTENLQHDVGRAKDLGALGHDLGAFVDVVRIGIAGLDAGAGFDDDFQSRLFKVGDYCGHKRDAPLSRKDLAGNTDNHEASSLARYFATQRRQTPRRNQCIHQNSAF